MKWKFCLRVRQMQKISSDTQIERVLYSMVVSPGF